MDVSQPSGYLVEYPRAIVDFNETLTTSPFNCNFSSRSTPHLKLFLILCNQCEAKINKNLFRRGWKDADRCLIEEGEFYVLFSYSQKIGIFQYLWAEPFYICFCLIFTVVLGIRKPRPIAQLGVAELGFKPRPSDSGSRHLPCTTLSSGAGHLLPCSSLELPVTAWNLGWSGTYLCCHPPQTRLLAPPAEDREK